MRYETPIYFVRAVPGEYDPKTGDYADDTLHEVKVYASVMDTKEEAMRLVYGAIKQGSLTIHLQNHYSEPFDYIRVADKRYTVDYHRRLQIKDAYIVSEVQ